MYRQELKLNKITHVCGHVVNLFSSPVNVMFDFSNNLKYGICWNFDHVWVQQEKGFQQLAEKPGLRQTSVS